MPLLAELDFRSLSVATIVASIPLGVLTALAHRFAPELRGPGHWRVASVLVVAAFALYIASAGGAVLSATADLLALLALFQISAGVRPANDPARGAIAAEAVTTALLFAWLTWFTFGDDRPWMRAVGASAVLGLAALRLAAQVGSALQRPFLLRAPGALAFGVMGLAFLYRSAAVWTQGPQSGEALGLGPTAVLPLLATLLAVVGGCAALLAMSENQLLASYRVQQERLEKLALLDVLTGLPNRRALFEELQRRTSVARRSGRPLSLVLLDADRFKAINDGVGHAGGDDALRAMADRLSAGLRDADTCARFGGEEFVVLLPDTDHAEALTVVERLRRAVSELRPLGPDGPPLTASFGVACWRPEEGEGGPLIARADALMYQAKREGGDRIALEKASPVA